MKTKLLVLVPIALTLLACWHRAPDLPTINVEQTSPPSDQDFTAKMREKERKLTTLRELLNDRLISEAEYQHQKKEILDGL